MLVVLMLSNGVIHAQVNDRRNNSLQITFGQLRTLHYKDPVPLRLCLLKVASPLSRRHGQLAVLPSLSIMRCT